ncbi:MAG: heme-binding protein, partial [Nitrospira sp.]|nr:heme-binding protein [Nitrospira sp.]
MGEQIQVPGRVVGCVGLLAGALLAAGWLGAAHAADELPKESVLPAALAGKAAQAALDACKKDGYRVSASVVDRAGVLRAMLRADGAGPHT